VQNLPFLKPGITFQQSCFQQVRALKLKLWPCFASASEKIREVLDCGSPLPLSRRQQGGELMDVVS
jgi:hypothetical protein